MTQNRPIALVTGAAGYTGHAIALSLADRGYTVRALDLRAAPKSPNLEPIVGDLADADALARAAEGAELVVHTAAIVPFGLPTRISREKIAEVNVVGTERVLAAAENAGAARFVLLSSTGVAFGGDPISGGDESLPEPIRFIDDYSWSKAEAERRVLGAAREDFQTVAIRPNGIWGPDEQHHQPKLLKFAKMGMNQFKWSPDARTDFTHRDNIVHAVNLSDEAMKEGREGVSGEAFFITDDEHFHALDFYVPLLEGLGYALPKYELPAAAMFAAAFFCEAGSRLLAPVKSIEPFFTHGVILKITRDNYYSCEKAKARLGYEPVVRRADGMIECVRHYRAQGLGKGPDRSGQPATA